MDILYIIIVGAIAGWLAGLVMKGSGYGLLTNVILGIIGAFVGGWLFKELGLYAGTSLASTILTSMVGAIVVIAIARLIRR